MGFGDLASGTSTDQTVNNQQVTSQTGAAIGVGAGRGQGFVGTGGINLNNLGSTNKNVGNNKIQNQINSLTSTLTAQQNHLSKLKPGTTAYKTVSNNIAKTTGKLNTARASVPSVNSSISTGTTVNITSTDTNALALADDAIHAIQDVTHGILNANQPLAAANNAAVAAGSIGTGLGNLASALGLGSSGGGQPAPVDTSSLATQPYTGPGGVSAPTTQTNYLPLIIIGGVIAFLVFAK